MRKIWLWRTDMNLLEKAADAEKLEALVADIKSTLESCFSDESKVKLIYKAIQKAGY